jgi:hypothetical protein
VLDLKGELGVPGGFSWKVHWMNGLIDEYQGVMHDGQAQGRTVIWNGSWQDQYRPWDAQTLGNCPKWPDQLTKADPPKPLDPKDARLLSLTRPVRVGVVLAAPPPVCPAARSGQYPSCCPPGEVYADGACFEVAQSQRSAQANLSIKTPKLHIGGVRTSADVIPPRPITPTFRPTWRAAGGFADVLNIVGRRPRGGGNQPTSLPLRNPVASHIPAPPSPRTAQDNGLLDFGVMAKPKSWGVK